MLTDESRRCRTGEGVGFGEFAAEERSVGQVGLVVGDQGRRGGAGEWLCDPFRVFRGAEEDADGGALVGFADNAVEGFEVEFEFAEVLGLEGFYLPFEGNERWQTARVKEEVETKIFVADLAQVFLADEAKVAAEFDAEAAEVGDERMREIGFDVGLRPCEKNRERALARINHTFLKKFLSHRAHRGPNRGHGAKHLVRSVSSVAWAPCPL